MRTTAIDGFVSTAEDFTARIKGFLAADQELLATCEAVGRRFDDRAAELDRRRADMDAEGTRITEKANATAYEIIGNAHKAAAEIVGEARKIADAEAQRHAGQVRERQDTITALDAEIAARVAMRDDITSQIAELRTRLGG